MLETQSRIIGNHTYHVRQLGAGEARRLLVRLTKAMGPVIGAFMEDAAKVPEGAKGLPKTPGLLDTNVLSMSRALQELALRLREEDLEYVCKVLGSATQVETEPGRMVPLTLEAQELHFRGGHLAEMFRWLGFALEVQYADFFGAFGAVTAGLGAGERKGT